MFRSRGLKKYSCCCYVAGAGRRGRAHEKLGRGGWAGANEYQHTPSFAIN